MLSANRNAKKRFYSNGILSWQLTSTNYFNVCIQKSCIKILKLSVDQIITIIIFQEYMHIKLLVNKISHLIPETYEGHQNT